MTDQEKIQQLLDIKISTMKVEKDDVVIVEMQNPSTFIGEVLRNALNAKYGFTSLVFCVRPGEKITEANEAKMLEYGWKRDIRGARNRKIQKRYRELRAQRVKRPEALEKVKQELCPEIEIDTIKTICYTK